MVALRRILALAALALLVPAPVLAAGSCPAHCFEGNMLYDKGAGICLPAALPGFQPIPRTREDIEAMYAVHTITAGFVEPQPRLAMTVFVYERPEQADEADLAHLKANIGQIREVHPTAKGERIGRGVLPVNGEPAPGMGGFFTWTEGKADFGSFLWVIPYGARYIKVRATFETTPSTVQDRTRRAAEKIQLLARRICVGEGGKP